MKITHFISGLTKGGGERVAAELANIGVFENHEVTIVAGWPVDNALLQDSLDPRINVKFVAKSRILSYPNSLIWVIKNKEYLKTQDVIHCHLTFGSFLGSLVWFFIRLSKTKIVETYHAVGMKIPNFNRAVHAKLMRMRNGVIMMASDNYWDKFLSKYSSISSTTIYNGIKPLEPKARIIRTQLCKKLGINEKDTILIGTISALRPDRNPTNYVLIMCELLKKTNTNIHFILGGEGTERFAIEELIREHKLESNFHLMGLVNEPQDVLRNIDIYVSVSVGQITGISMIEAAMCKLPVIGIQMLNDYKAKSSDWCWSSNDNMEVVDRLKNLVKNKNLRMDEGNKQFDYVNSNLTSKAMFKKYVDFYKSLDS